MRTLIEAVDKVPPWALLAVNSGIALLVGAAHGGAVLISQMQSSPDAESIQRLATISLPSVAFLLLSAAVVVFARKLLMRVLAVQAVILFVGALASYVWAVSLLVYGIPRGNFSWGVGWFTVFCVYPVYLLRRTVLEPLRVRHWRVMYAHIIALALAAPVDVGVFIRAAVDSSKRKPNQAMQLTASKPAVYAVSVGRRARMLRSMHRGLAAADLVSR